MQTTTKSEPMKSKKTDLHLVDIRIIEIQEGFNIRTDYGDMEGLVSSIREHGVIQPLRCFRKDGRYFLIDGHRRHKACMVLVDEGIDIRVAVVTEGKQVSQEQRVIDMMTLNEGKRLNPLEEAEAVNRLLNYGLQEIEISKKIGKTLTYISNLKLLYSAPEKIKMMVRSEQISSTLLLKLMRDTSDFDELQNLIHTTFTSISGVVGEKPVKITSKHVQKVQKKTNSVSALRKAFKLADKKALAVNPLNEKTYAFAKAIIDGEYTKDELIKMFFCEPKPKAPETLKKGVKDRAFEALPMDLKFEEE
jgi:ParB/RepB/Spo0J family partition protein